MPSISIRIKLSHETVTEKQTELVTAHAPPLSRTTP